MEQDESGHQITRSVTPPDSVQANHGVLGVTITNGVPDPVQVLNKYKDAFTFHSNPIILLFPSTIVQEVVPYSDLMAPKYHSSILGPAFPVVHTVPELQMRLNKMNLSDQDLGKTLLTAANPGANLSNAIVPWHSSL
jgi:hypothetical protein